MKYTILIALFYFVIAVSSDKQKVPRLVSKPAPNKNNNNNKNKLVGSSRPWTDESEFPALNCDKNNCDKNKKSVRPRIVSGEDVHASSRFGEGEGEGRGPFRRRNSGEGRHSRNPCRNGITSVACTLFGRRYVSPLNTGFIYNNGPFYGYYY